MKDEVLVNSFFFFRSRRILKYVPGAIEYEDVYEALNEFFGFRVKNSEEDEGSKTFVLVGVVPVLVGGSIKLST